MLSREGQDEGGRPWRITSFADFWLPPEACSYRIALVAIRKQYAGHGRRVMMAVWSHLRQFTYTKFVIVTDEGRNSSGTRNPAST